MAAMQKSQGLRGLPGHREIIALFPTILSYHFSDRFKTCQLTAPPIPDRVHTADKTEKVPI
jgi:hypothetical protein